MTIVATAEEAFSLFHLLIFIYDSNNHVYYRNIIYFRQQLQRVAIFSFNTSIPVSGCFRILIMVLLHLYAATNEDRHKCDRDTNRQKYEAFPPSLNFFYLIYPVYKYGSWLVVYPGQQLQKRPVVPM